VHAWRKQIPNMYENVVINTKDHHMDFTEPMMEFRIRRSSLNMRIRRTMRSSFSIFISRIIRKNDMFSRAPKP